MAFYADDNPYQQSSLPYQPYQRPTEQPRRNDVPPASPRPPVTKRMPKAQALALVRKFKAGLIVSSVVLFGILSGLVATQLTSSTSSSTAASNTTTTINTPSYSDNGGFFGRRQGGYGFGDASGQSGITHTQAS